MVAVAAPSARPVVLDVDTGIDDALAILYAVAHEGLSLRAVTGVCGNLALDQVMINTARVLALAGAGKVPFAAGAAKSLRGSGARPRGPHGTDGLGDLDLRTAGQAPDPAGARALWHRELTAANEPVTIVLLAPQTNAALFMREQPGARRQVSAVVFMGGRLDDGPAEFNIEHDPEAAAEVLAAGLPIMMYPYDLFPQVSVTDAQRARLAASSWPGAQLAADLLSHSPYGRIGDAGALIMLTHPRLFDIRRVPIRIGPDGAERGRTIVDPQGTAVEVAVEMDAAGAAQAFVDTLERRQTGSSDNGRRSGPAPA